MSVPADRRTTEQTEGQATGPAADLGGREPWAIRGRAGDRRAAHGAALRLRVVQGCANMGLCPVQPLCRAVWGVSLLVAACGFVTA